jgi:hypothetical protein
MPRTSRREFAKSVIVAGAALPLLAQTAPPALEVVKARFGEHLVDEDLERLATTLQEHARLLETLRAYKLANADEPDFTFSALTERW